MDSLNAKDKKQKNEGDNRIPCKYGSRCYQKNPNHMKRFTHPPKLENQNNEVTGKKRKTPSEDSESSSSKTPKVTKLDDSSKDKNLSDKTEDSKIDENIKNDESISEEVKKEDSDQITESDSTTEQVTNDETETNTEKEAAISKTETPIEQEKANDTTDVHNTSNTKSSEEKMDVEEKDLQENDVKEKIAEENTEKTDTTDTKEEVAEENIEKVDTKENDTKENDIKESDKKENNTEEKGTEKKDVEAKDMTVDAEKKDVEAKDTTVDAEKKKDEAKTTVENKSTDDAGNKPKTKTDKVEKVVDDNSKAPDSKGNDHKRPNNREITDASPKQNVQERRSYIKPDISRPDNHSEARKLILKAFLVSMPNDFYKFYDFCKDLKPAEPSTAFKIVDLKLVGPYDVLTGLITKEIAEKTNLLTHWRYYYDPPEFQTIVKGNDREGLHFGYWRDRPSSDPIFVATNCSNVSHKIKPVAENIFGAIAYYLEERGKKANPFDKSGILSLLGKLRSYARKYNISLEQQSDKMKSRERTVVARTIHGAGIACPYNKKTQLGYRELSVTDNQLLKIVKKLDDAQDEEQRIAAHSELGEVVRLATIAGDECDFGTCLELGHDLLSTGCSHVQNAALSVLSIAYNQLERQPFLKIVEAHMQNRKKSSNPTALDNVSKE